MVTDSCLRILPIGLSIGKGIRVSAVSNDWPGRFVLRLRLAPEFSESDKKSADQNFPNIS